ncbi:neuron navigator 1 isoform X2 [Ambystoma mexicanum]|uniref:neuron navigator 1 isoform X2 n=1 Tax=Ambystoma mexicanum TaxID=8296 RepID=UPI0037E8EFA6
MNGSANVSAPGRSHYASAIPVPRSFSPGKIQGMAASPKQPRRQPSTGPASPSVAYASQKTSSPKPVKAVLNTNSSASKNPKQKTSPGTSIGVLEKRTPTSDKALLPDGKQAAGYEGGLSPCGGSPWGSPRLGQKISPRSREAYKKILDHGLENEKESDQKTADTSGTLSSKMGLVKSSMVSSLVGETTQAQGKPPTRLSLYNDNTLLGSIEALKAKRPQSCPAKGQWVPEGNCRTQEGTRVLPANEKISSTLPGSGIAHSNGQVPASKGMALSSGTINFSSVMPQTPPVTATVAPFQYKLQQGDGDENDSSDGDCDDSITISDVTEISFMDLEKGMLGSNLKGSHHAVDLGGEDGTEDLSSFQKTTAEAKTMMQKRVKPPGVQRAGELRVFKSGSVDTKLPPSSNLRKQKSLTNLSFMTDAEKKMQLYEPKWCDDMSKAAQGYGRGAPKPREAPTISKTLSKSEHSLFQSKLAPGLGKPPLAPSTSNIGKPSRIPRGPYAEVKPLTKTPDTCVADDVKSDDEIMSSKAKAQQNQNLASGKGQDDKAFLKVDPELVVTVLGDLEQLLFSQMLDPESQRKRTVQNVLDLRQNLEDTMTSLRGSQVSHSSLEMTCYDSDEANPRSVSSLSNRSSPISWRYGQSSPRLQAGDAPSVGGGCRNEGANPSWFMHGERSHYSHTMPMRSPSKLSHISRLELIEALDPDDGDLKSGYMSDGDLPNKPILTEDEDITTGWDESSSISSGLSDASDNLSSEEFNASSSLNSLPTTPTASRRNSAVALRTDAEKRSLVESGLTWYSESEEKTPKKLEYDSGSLKMEHSSRWRREHTESYGDEPPKGELKKPVTLGQPGSLKKGKNPPVAVTSPITHSVQSTLKVAGSCKGEAKATDKTKLSIKNTGLQRSSSDASRDQRVADAKKPPSGIARPSTSGGSFGYKKPPPATGTATVMTGGSATMSKIQQKTSGIPVKPVGGGRKTSLDVSNGVEPGFMSPGARSNIQYRSLPRPAKSSCMSVTGGRGNSRPVSSSIDPSVLSTKQGNTGGSKLKEPSKIGGGRAATTPVNQTDREKEKAKAKAVAQDSECTPIKPISSPEMPTKVCFTPPAKVSEVTPTMPLRAAVKGFSKPPSMASLDKINSNSLEVPPVADSPPVRLHEHIPSVASVAATHLTPCLTPSPAPVLNINSASFSQGLELMSGFTVPKDLKLLPKLSGLHRSMESLQMPMSVPTSYVSAATPLSSEEDLSETGWTGSLKTTQLDSAQRDRNTLPKKGFRFQSHSQDEAKERRHSHTIGGLQDSDDSLPLPSPPPPLSIVTTTKLPLTNIVSPTSITAPRISRSNSIPTQESPFELYSGTPLGSTLSLAERPKGMMTRSGSFRDPADDVHGSVLSLASSASSTYSSAEERMQSEQIRKLRRELENSQEKVATLTTQLSANANLVAAFEQSLVNMTSRLRQLADTAEEKDTELVELRETIEFLKTKNTEASEVIQGALNPSDITPRELRIRRQNSSDSISSLNSITSHSSVGSSKESDAKKKKKKSWLRSSFNKAFSIKKGPKSASSYSDIEEIATPDSSAPSSPKMQHGTSEPGTTSPSIKSSTSSSVIFEGNDGEEPEKKVVSELRSELWEKEMKLTDIRLEALNSAHQLDQLRETMHNMQLEVDLLKAENDRLKVPGSTSIHGSILSTSATSSPRRSLGLALTHSFSLSLADPANPDLSPMDGINGCSQKEEVSLRVVVRLPLQHIIKGDLKQQEFFLGCVKVSLKADWRVLDEAICQVFLEYVAKMDPASTLGLTSESLYAYSISHVKRVLELDAPEMPPCRNLRGASTIALVLKGLKEKCVDSLVFETLIPKPMMQHYISLLLKHRRLILSGPSGTGKTYLTNRLSEYLVERSGRDVSEGILVTFNMHQQSCKDLQLYLSNLANQIDRETGIGDVPLVILLDDISEPGSISELVNGALTCKYHKCPYIIGTTNQPVKMTPNHSLHLSFRMLTFSNNVEPANGFLVRYLRRKLLESDSDINANKEELLRVLDWVPKLWYHLHTFLEKHSTSDFLIGPCFFLSCPIGIEDFRVWFIDLWNNSIIPYLQEGAKDGIKVHGQKAAWEDPVEWVRDTLPWPSAQQDQSKLYHLPPPTVAPHSIASPAEERTTKETTPNSLDSDPLMAMLLKLQEAANYIESPDCETIGDPNLQATL